MKRVDELLAQAGLSMADVDLQSLSKISGELDRLDERDERLAARRDEILRQIERRRSVWAKLVRNASEEIIEGEFHELPSGTPDIEAGPRCPRIRMAGRRVRTRNDKSEKIIPSDLRLRANRANAARSTGPRTKAGKAATRLNALRTWTGGGVAQRAGRGPREQALALTIRRKGLRVFGLGAQLRMLSWACGGSEARK